MTETATLILVVLSGGFYFTENFLPVKYRSARENGHRLYFRVLFWSTILALSASLILFVGLAALLYLKLDYLSFSKLWLEYSRFFEGSARIGVAISTIPLAWVASHGFNLLLYYKEGKINLLKRIVGDRKFEELTLHALLSTKPLLVTLDTGKVYVGLVTRAPDLLEPKEHFSIMLLKSGYRDPSTHRVHLTTSYSDIIREIRDGEKSNFSHLSQIDFEIVLQTNHIVSACIFDFNVHASELLLAES